MNVLDFPEGPRHKATDVSSWYGVYFSCHSATLPLIDVMFLESGMSALLGHPSLGHSSAITSNTRISVLFLPLKPIRVWNGLENVVDQQCFIFVVLGVQLFDDYPEFC